jgi:hypothetical protein
MGDLQAMTIPELEGTIDALLARAGAVSPPRNIVESEQQAIVLRQLARMRDEQRRRSRAALPLAHVEPRGRQKRAWVEHAPREAEIDGLIERLEEMQEHAGANLLHAGRDPRGGKVLLTGLRDTMALRGVPAPRFRKIIAACERRGLVLLAGPFIEIADGRSPARRAAGAAHRVLEVAP